MVMSIYLMASLILVLVGAMGVLLVRYQLGKIFGNKEIQPILRLWSIQFFEVLCSALIVFGLAGLLLETPIFSNFFERSIGRIFTRTLTDPSYLRESFSTDRLKQIRNSSIEALAKQPVEAGRGSLLELIENKILPWLNEPIRENLEIRYEQQIINVGGVKALKVYQSTSWNFKNLTNEPISYTQLVDNILEPLPGVKPEDLFRIIKFKVGDQDLASVLRLEKMEDGRFRFKGKFDFKIMGTADVIMVFEKIVPLNDHVTIWVTMPTKGLRFLYIHPPNFKPSIVVLGLGDSGPDLIESRETSKLWKYDGWLLEKHGIVLTWSIVDK